MNIKLTSSEVQHITNPDISDYDIIGELGSIRNRYEFKMLLENKGFIEKDKISMQGDSMGNVTITYDGIPNEPSDLKELRREYTL